jgi:hypothetical protein
MSPLHHPLIPANAGTQVFYRQGRQDRQGLGPDLSILASLAALAVNLRPTASGKQKVWVPAFAGMSGIRHERG